MKPLESAFLRSRSRWIVERSPHIAYVAQSLDRIFFKAAFKQASHLRRRCVQLRLIFYYGRKDLAHVVAGEW
jgi:hypothetical protein